MNGLPTIHAEGTLTADPEVRFTPAGHAVTKYRIACNKRVYDKSAGEWREDGTTFITGSAWRDLGLNLAESCHKGDRIVVVGSLTQREWEADDGTKRTAYEIDTTEVGVSVKFEAWTGQ